MRSMILALGACMYFAALGCARTAQVAGPPPPFYPIMPIKYRDLGEPVAGAVLIAPGYLLTSMSGMEEIAPHPRDPSFDGRLGEPTVFVFDGKEWRKGEYLDFDRGLGVALIRADVEAAPIQLQTERKAPTYIVGIPSDVPIRTNAVVHEMVRPSPCVGLDAFIHKAFLRERRSSGPSLCFSNRLKHLPGAAVLDADGRLAGIISLASADDFVSNMPDIGADASEIRSFMETHFASWGRDVVPKPKF